MTFVVGFAVLVFSMMLVRLGVDLFKDGGRPAGIACWVLSALLVLLTLRQFGVLPA